MGRRFVEVDEQRVKAYRADGKSGRWIALRMAISTTVVRGILTGSRVVPSASKGIVERQASKMPQVHPLQAIEK